MVALLAEFREDGEKKIIGACRYVTIDINDQPRCAEVAFTVLDSWHNNGLGKIFFRHLADIGRACGIEKFEAVVLSENRGMMKVFTSTGLKVNTRPEEGDVHFDIILKG